MLTMLRHVFDMIANAPLSWVLLTMAVYTLAERVQRVAGGHALLNPVPVSIVLLAGCMALTGTDYRAYAADTQPISILLGPAAVALGLPLYRQRARIRMHGPEIIVSILIGSAVAAGSAVAIAFLLGATPDVLRSIAPKSVTVAVAVGVSNQIGGIASLTAVFVIFTGVCGSLLSERLFDWIGVRDWMARGLATGLAGHGIGTAAILKRNEVAGAFAGLALGLNALLTAVLLPLCVALLH